MSTKKKLVWVGVALPVLDALIAAHQLEGETSEQAKNAVATHIMGVVGKDCCDLRELWRAGWSLVDAAYDKPRNGPISHSMREMAGRSTLVFAGVSAAT